MMRKVAISLVLCAALAALLAASAAAEEAPAGAGGGSESSPLPPLVGPNGEPIDVGGAVEGAVQGAAGAVAGTVEAATGGGSPPPPTPPAGTDPGSGSSGGTVGKVVTGTTKAAGDAVAAVKGDVEAVTGSVNHTSHPAPTPTDPPDAAAPESSSPSPEAAPSPSGAPETAVTSPGTATRRTSSPSQRGGTTARRPAAPSPQRRAGDLAQNRRIVHALVPGAAERSLPSSALEAVAASVRGAFGTSAGAATGSSGTNGASDRTDDDASVGSGHALRLADFSPDHPLGILLFLLVLGGGAFALTVVMRRELGMSFLPWRRFRG